MAEEGADVELISLLRAVMSIDAAARSRAESQLLQLLSSSSSAFQRFIELLRDPEQDQMIKQIASILLRRLLTPDLAINSVQAVLACSVYLSSVVFRSLLRALGSSLDGRDEEDVRALLPAMAELPPRQAAALAEGVAEEAASLCDIVLPVLAPAVLEEVSEWSEHASDSRCPCPMALAAMLPNKEVEAVLRSLLSRPADDRGITAQLLSHCLPVWEDGHEQVAEWMTMQHWHEQPPSAQWMDVAKLVCDKLPVSCLIEVTISSLWYVLSEVAMYEGDNVLQQHCMGLLLLPALCTGELELLGALREEDCAEAMAVVAHRAETVEESRASCYLTAVALCLLFDGTEVPASMCVTAEESAARMDMDEWYNCWASRLLLAAAFTPLPVVEMEEFEAAAACERVLRLRLGADHCSEAEAREEVARAAAAAESEAGQWFDLPVVMACLQSAGAEGDDGMMDKVESWHRQLMASREARDG
eukprot:PLAT12130.1.p1 GENE.PLAT12130.1~~PLAT12130.1.p1  ORF type:complete len:475 (-),score=197.29 PLAT12130.1:488-1912(-)